MRRAVTCPDTAEGWSEVSAWLPFVPERVHLCEAAIVFLGGADIHMLQTNACHSHVVISREARFVLGTLQCKRFDKEVLP